MKTITPRPYLSYSQISSFQFSSKRFLETYYYGKFADSPQLRLGKRLAIALEFREKKETKWITDIVKQIPDAEKREYKIETQLGKIKLVGILDGYFPKENKIYEYKTGAKPAMAFWRKQMLFYSLLCYQNIGKIPTKIELFHAPTKFNNNEQLIFCGNVNKYKIDISLKDVILFTAEVLQTWKDIQKLCQQEYDMFGKLPFEKQ